MSRLQGEMKRKPPAPGPEEVAAARVAHALLYPPSFVHRAAWQPRGTWPRTVSWCGRQGRNDTLTQTREHVTCRTCKGSWDVL